MKRFTKLIQSCGLVVLTHMVQAESPLEPIQYVRGEPVFSSPYLGERSDFEAFDLIVNIPDVEQSLRLLEQMQDAEKRLSKRGYTMPTQPTVDLSGRIEMLGSVEQDFGKSRYTQSFGLEDAELDVFARINRWAMAFFNMKYDKNPIATPRSGTGVSERDLDNSRFYLDQGFITLGNLNSCPLYLVGGQIHVPFGTGDTSLLTGPLTRGYSDTKQRVILIGFKSGADSLNYNAAVYGFNSSYRDRHNDGGAKIGLNFSESDVSASVSGGVISNILEAEMYQNSGDKFSGFAVFSSGSSKQPTSRTVGWTAFAKVSYKTVSLQGEYVTAASSLPIEFFQDGAGDRIKPSAFHIEASTSQKLHTIPSLFAIGYGGAKQSLALEQPRHKVYASIIIEPIKSTLFGIEYSRAHDYAKGAQAKSWGYAGTAKDPSLNQATDGTGDWKSMINIFFGYYF